MAAPGIGGGAVNKAARAGTCPAGAQAAIPFVHTSVWAVTWPAATPCWICATLYGPPG